MSHERKNKLIQYYLFGILILVSYFLLLAAYWLFYPYKIITYSDLPYQTAKTEYVQGDITTYSFKFCKHLELPATVEKQFVDGLLFMSEGNKNNLPLGCHKAVIQLHIPETLPAGEYKLRTTARYRVNPIRIIEVVNETNTFNVREAK